MLKRVTVYSMLLVYAVATKWYDGDFLKYNLSTSNQEDERGCRVIEVRLDHDVGLQWDVTSVQLAETTIARITSHTCNKNSDTIKAGATTKSRITTKCPPPEETCPSQFALQARGYELLPGHGYYKIYKYEKTWHEAKKLCEEEQAYLTFPKSEAQMSSWMSLIGRKGRVGKYWIGLHDLYTEGQYVNIFNETVQSTPYNKWMPGEPDGGRIQNCGIILYHGEGNYELENGGCDDAVRWFFCEKNV